MAPRAIIAEPYEHERPLTAQKKHVQHHDNGSKPVKTTTKTRVKDAQTSLTSSFYSVRCWNSEAIPPGIPLELLRNSKSRG